MTVSGNEAVIRQDVQHPSLASSHGHMCLHTQAHTYKSASHLQIHHTYLYTKIKVFMVFRASVCGGLHSCHCAVEIGAGVLTTDAICCEDFHSALC